jgi:hypothetical protein
MLTNVEEILRIKYLDYLGTEIEFISRYAFTARIAHASVLEVIRSLESHHLITTLEAASLKDSASGALETAMNLPDRGDILNPLPNRKNE